MTAASKYHRSLKGSVAEEYLGQRALVPPEWDDVFQLGYVEDPEPGHAAYQGKLAIPYIRYHPRNGATCVAIRFRTLEPGGQPKYMSQPGDPPRLYNTRALHCGAIDVGIAEGELDAITATICGLPTVGVPGANNWQDYWAGLFAGFRRVFVFTDGDKPGRSLGRIIAQQLPNSQIITLPDGEDLNSLYVAGGKAAIRGLWEKKGNV